MLNKKALSPVVATILIIMLTVSAVAIISSFIIPFVKTNLEDSTACVQYQQYFTIVEKFEEAGSQVRYNCHETPLKKHGISIKAQVSEDLAENVEGFVLVFTGSGTSNPLTIKSGDLESCSSNGIRAISSLCTGTGAITIPGPGETRTYVHHADTVYDKVEVHPLLKTGPCEKTAEISFIECPTGLLN